MATTNPNARQTYGNYGNNVNPQGQRQRDLSWYQDAVGRIKNKGFQQGSDLYNKNAQRIYDVGRRWGLNYKQHIGDWAPQANPDTTTTAAVGSIAAPTGLRPENLPMYNLLNDDERRKFLRMRSSDPRAALRWMQGTTKGRQAPTPPTTDQTETQTPPADPPADTPSTEPSTADPGGFNFASYQSPMTKALMDAMAQGMNTMQAYEPKFFEGSPLYQFQKQKGLGDLEKLMAARGLTGSGAEIQGNSDFLANINATEAEKQRQYAETNRDRQQRAMEFIANFDQSEREALRDQWNKDLDQKTNIQQFEAGRQDGRQALMTNFLSNLLGLQSQNDIARIAQGGMNSQTDLSKALMSMIGQNIMSQVSRPSGGGGGSPPPPQPSNMTDFYKIIMGYGNRAGNNDVLNGILRMFG